MANPGRAEFFALPAFGLTPYARCHRPVLHPRLIQRCSGVIDHLNVHLLGRQGHGHKAGCTAVEPAPFGGTWLSDFGAGASVKIFYGSTHDMLEIMVVPVEIGGHPMLLEQWINVAN